MTATKISVGEMSLETPIEQHVYILFTRNKSKSIKQ